jgi:hypothetical protein
VVGLPAHAGFIAERKEFTFGYYRVYHGKAFRNLEAHEKSVS